MLNVESYFIMLIILLNLVNLLNFTFSYAGDNGMKFTSNLSLGLDVFFALYYTILLVFSANLFYSGRSIAGLIVFLLSIAPFFIEKSSMYKSEKSLTNLHIKALIVNLFIICLI